MDIRLPASNLVAVAAAVCAVASVITVALSWPMEWSVGLGFAVLFLLFSILHRNHQYAVRQLRESTRLRSTTAASVVEIAASVADVAGSVAELTPAMKQLNRAESDRLERIMARSDRATRSYLDDLFDQRSAVDTLRSLELFDRPIPNLRRWAISPDLALVVVERILDGEISDVLELGSGASTVVFGRAIERSGRPGRVVAIDHDAGYLEASRRLISSHGLAGICEVVHAPLGSVPVESEDVCWYDFDDRVIDGSFDMMFVDGPPEATGPLARWPAMPRLGHLLAPGAVVIMDDGDRESEQQIAEKWLANGYVTSSRTLPVERGAIEMRTPAER